MAAFTAAIVSTAVNDAANAPREVAVMSLFMSSLLWFLAVHV
jgi:hypothetical protein